MYSIVGTFNKDSSNVIWISHPFTANLDVTTWWNGVIGKGKPLDTDKYCVVCANVPGSPYGSLYPFDINPETKEKYYYDFPEFSTHDVVDMFEFLRLHLKIPKIKILSGASMGGQIVYQWLVSYPKAVEHAIIIAADAQISPWMYAMHIVQQDIIRLDNTWGENTDFAGRHGMGIARKIGVISYRSSCIFHLSQSQNKVISNAADEGGEISSFENVKSYMDYQGEQFLSRFNAYSYNALIIMMNSHDVSKGYANLKQALQRVESGVLIIGIDSDILFPVEDLKRTKKMFKQAVYKEISSIYGHDAFLVEQKQLEDIIHEYLIHIGEM